MALPALRGNYSTTQTYRDSYTKPYSGRLHSSQVYSEDPGHAATARPHYFVIRLLTPGEALLNLREGGVLVTAVFSEEDQVWVATDAVSLEYGTGETPEESVEEFRKNLVSMAQWFKNNKASLGPHMEDRLRTFQALFPGM